MFQDENGCFAVKMKGKFCNEKTTFDLSFVSRSFKGKIGRYFYSDSFVYDSQTFLLYFLPYEAQNFVFDNVVLGPEGFTVQNLPLAISRFTLELRVPPENRLMVRRLRGQIMCNGGGWVYYIDTEFRVLSQARSNFKYQLQNSDLPHFVLSPEYAVYAGAVWDVS